MSRIVGLDPIVDGKREILILGSMPSVQSLKKQMYYAHPSNRFWKVIGALSNLPTQSKEEKERALESLKIALWDAIGSCERIGSADSTITKESPNDIEDLLRRYPSIQKVICNGKLSEKMMKKYHPSIEVISCPSTSAANAQYGLEALTREYRKNIGGNND